MILFESFILVVVGLAFEARIAGACKGASICCRRGDAGASAMHRALDDPACRGVVSFGIAGGLDRRVRSGTHLVASHVITPQGAIETDRDWSNALLRSCPDAVHAPILGTDHVVVSDTTARVQAAPMKPL